MNNRTLAVLFVSVLVSRSAAAQAPAGKAATFDSAKQAADALVAAAAKNDRAALSTIFGPAGKDLLAEVGGENADALTTFAEKARENVSLVPEPGNPNAFTMEVGADGWPVPSPIVKSGGKWSFDAVIGEREIAARRVGLDELDAIALLRGYVEAQVDYASAPHDGATLLQYAARGVSSPGKHDGLCWKEADGSAGGPVSEEVARVLWDGKTGKPQAYNGYFFRILTAQGASAPLGARSYFVEGALVGGFGLLAWPEQYGVTGVQTFVVNQDGLVYQKDLGAQTATAAAAIKTYNPDKTWIVTDDEND